MILFVLGITIFIESFRFWNFTLLEQNADVCSFMFQCQGAVWFQGTFFCVMFWHLRANLILCIDVALHYLKPVGNQQFWCVQLIFIILLTTILLCKVSPSGVGKGAHPVCLNIFFRLFGCSCSGFKNSMPYGWKTYWTSLAVTHLLLGCCFYARKISINI